jgi:hypothetical protein
MDVIHGRRDRGMVSPLDRWLQTTLRACHPA